MNFVFFSLDRSSLNANNDKTTYGAFLDVDPVRENVSLRSLVRFFFIRMEHYHVRVSIFIIIILHVHGLKSIKSNYSRSRSMNLTIFMKHLQIDHSIVESFGSKGKACITARVYPRLAIGDKAGLYAFNNGTESVTIAKLRAWSLKKAQII